MNRRLFLIYTIVFLLCGVMLYLYRSNYRNVKKYILEINIITSQVLHLERLDALVRFWARNEKAEDQDATDKFFVSSGSAYDSIQNRVIRVREMTLYQEQRMRLDSIWFLVKEHQRHVELSGSSPGHDRIFFRQIDDLMQRCFGFARYQLNFRRLKLEESTELLDQWLHRLLILAAALIVLATFYSFNFLEQRRRAEGRSMTILETTNNGMISISPDIRRDMVFDYRITYCNTAAMRMLGLQNCRGKTLTELVVEDRREKLRNVFDNVLLGNRPHALEGYFEYGGERRYLQASIVPLNEGLLVSIYDLSELKQFEQRLLYKIRQLRIANDELTQYAYITSHDLQEPLRKIEMFSDIAMNSTTPPAKREEMLSKIRKSASRMRDLIQAMLYFTRTTYQPDKLQRVSLSDAAREAVVSLEEKVSRRSTSP